MVDGRVNVRVYAWISTVSYAIISLYIRHKKREKKGEHATVRTRPQLFPLLLLFLSLWFDKGEGSNGEERSRDEREKERRAEQDTKDEEMKMKEF